MNLLADENIDRSLVERLRTDGHAIVYAAELTSGADDATILAQANDRQAVLVTEDKDFGELVFRQRLVHAGVILVRLSGLGTSAKSDLVAHVLKEHPQQLTGPFSVISPGLLRIRHTLE